MDVVAFRWLAAQQAPDFRLIARFRKRHLSSLGNVVLQALELCRAAGMVSLGQVELDGTKVRANASRRKAMSYARLTEKQKVLADDVSPLLADADAINDAEDARFGKDKRGDELPPELARRESRLVKLAETRAALEADAAARARKDAEKKAREKGHDDDTALQKGAVDVEQVVPLIEKLHATVGVLRQQILADAGYCLAANLDYAKTVEAASGGRTEFFIATGRVKHGERVPEVPRGWIPANATLRERMGRKLKTKKGRAVYARRKAIVEPVFGQIHTRQGKFLLLSGLDQAAHEWDLIAACHNLMKLHTLQTKARLAAHNALTARPAT
ncbi:DDE transposase [Cryobacterium sp. TMT1-19]|nr:MULTISPECIES: transposase [unclassified Cryobacterium]TFD35105.1 DDE transposase [Cryobacterium sp. TMT1-19]